MLGYIISSLSIGALSVIPGETVVRDPVNRTVSVPYAIGTGRVLHPIGFVSLFVDGEMEIQKGK